MKLITGNPYSFNSVALRRSTNDYNKIISTRNSERQELTPSAQQLQTRPVIHFLGKFLGVDTSQEWNQFADKIYDIFLWAKKKAKSEDLKQLVKVITAKLNASPTMHPRRINDLHIAIQLERKFSN